MHTSSIIILLFLNRSKVMGDIKLVSLINVVLRIFDRVSFMYKRKSEGNLPLLKLTLSDVIVAL